ncbi:MAG TPA: TonB-dependent receptor [Thermoanaerobaculales bacterium]|nr:TonB-dependent receptor [Thermoanaerobaculales bacterium]HQL30381.1 TonB-dependent receptor [Thermoanaerobaculales bacterium]HQN96021.1 TonB-dependent receptor [Thermoanaerobaculales bacterium]
MDRSMIYRPRVYLVLSAILVMIAPMAWAQSVTTGTVSGVVLLPDGTATAGATVVLEGPALVTGQRTMVSDNTGRFAFLSVPTGAYTVTTSLAGFNTNKVENVVVNAGSSIALTIDLAIAASTGEIIVTSEAPIVDTRSSTISTTFSGELLDVLPTGRESFYDLTLTAPGMASVGSDESWLPSPSAYGSAANENIFLVNGVNTTNPRGAPWGSLVQVNYDTVEQVKVLSLGSQAEYGSFSGAAVDVLTKSGSNDFHGSAAYYTQLGDAADNSTLFFGEDWLWADPEEDLTTQPDSNWEATATLGGPILKDKLWFYAGYSHRDSETDTPLWIPLAVYESDLYDLKLTGEFGGNHRAWLGLHYEDNFSGNVTWSPGWDPTMYYDSPVENTTWQFDYQWVISDTNLLGLKYLGFDTDQSPTTPSLVGHPGYINWWKWIGGRAVGTNGDFPYIEAQKSKRDTLQADFTHYAEDWAGSHEIKFGAQYTTANGDWYGGYFQNQANFAYPYGWGYTREYMNNAWWSCDYTWCIAPNDTVAFYNRVYTRHPWLNVRESDSLGFFVDDQWVVSDRVTLNLGLRYDNMTADYGEGKIYEYFDNPSDADNPVEMRSTAAYDVYDFTTWSPRIGVAWDITGDDRTVLRAHAGRYYAPLSVEALRRMGPDMGTYQQDTYYYWFPYEDVDQNGNNWIDPNEVVWATGQLYGMEPAYLQQSQTLDASWRLTVADGTSSPYTDQFNVSLQHQLGKDVAIELSYIYKLTTDFLILEPYNLETGEAFQWESRPYTTWTGYDTEVWSIVVEDFNNDGVIDGTDALYPANNDTRGWRANNLSEWNGQDVDRTYQGLQLVLNKRYSNRWQGSFAINYTDTDGFYPRVVDQNWYIDGPLTMDTPFGSSPNHFQNNLSGPALMTPEIMAKVAGSYTIPVIETDLGVRLRYDSGRAIFPIESYGPFYASWMGAYDPNAVLVGTGWHNFMVADDPEDPDWMPATMILDLSLQKRFGLGDWGGGLTIALDGLNILNEDAPNRVGFAASDYGQVGSIVMPQIFRLGVKLDF